MRLLYSLIPDHLLGLQFQADSGHKPFYNDRLKDRTGPSGFTFKFLELAILFMNGFRGTLSKTYIFIHLQGTLYFL